MDPIQNFLDLWVQLFCPLKGAKKVRLYIMILFYLGITNTQVRGGIKTSWQARFPTPNKKAYSKLFKLTWANQTFFRLNGVLVTMQPYRKHINCRLNSKGVMQAMQPSNPNNLFVRVGGGGI